MRICFPQSPSSRIEQKTLPRYHQGILSSGESIGEEIALHISQAQAVKNASSTLLSHSNAVVEMQFPKAQINEKDFMETTEDTDIFQDEQQVLSPYNVTPEETIARASMQASFTPSLSRAVETTAESESWLDARSHTESAVGDVVPAQNKLTGRNGDEASLLVKSMDHEVNNADSNENVPEEKADPLSIGTCSSKVLIVNVESLESKIKKGKDLAAVKAEIEKKLAEIKRLQAILQRLESESALIGYDTYPNLATDTGTNKFNEANNITSARKQFASIAPPSVLSVPVDEPTEATNSTVVSTVIPTFIRSDSRSATQPQETYCPSTDDFASVPTDGDELLRRTQRYSSLLTLSHSKQLNQQPSPSRSVCSQKSSQRKRKRSDMLAESAWSMDEDKEKEENALPATSSARAAVAPSLLAHVVVASRASPKQLISLPNSMSKAATVALSSSSTEKSSGQK